MAELVVTDDDDQVLDVELVPAPHDVDAWAEAAALVAGAIAGVDDARATWSPSDAPASLGGVVPPVPMRVERPV